MKKLKKNTYILILAFLMLVAGRLSHAQKTGDVTNVVTIDVLPEEGIYNKIWQPYIAMWKKDYYVVAYSLQITGKGDMGDILCSYTKDGGKSWSTPTMMYDHRIPNGSRQFGYANSVLFTPEGEKIMWFFGMRCPIYYSDSEDSELIASYSCDGGVSWQPVELQVHFASPLITNAGIVTVKENGEQIYSHKLIKN